MARSASSFPPRLATINTGWWPAHGFNGSSLARCRFEPGHRRTLRLQEAPCAGKQVESHHGEDGRPPACRDSRTGVVAADPHGHPRHSCRGAARCVSVHQLRGGRRVDDAHDSPYAREPQIEDLARICGALNRAGARYILIGGFAVIARGGTRTTKDIDLLIDPAPENVARVKQALRVLEDHAADEVADGDVGQYSVVRVADEIVVDLMAKACGIDYAAAIVDAESVEIGGVAVPVASLETLVRTKNTIRPSDAADRGFLEELLRATRGQK